jgi:hypothetical protein
MANDDLALETLLAVRKDVASEANAALLTNCYELQKKHQFDHDRGPSTQAMERLIEEEVARIIAMDGSKGAKK